jgi:predicted AlkP superfamily phosphohydrolase/phosphomutase
MSKTSKVLVIGLDCVPPEFVFERYSKDLPNISRLASSGVSGTVKSSVPPSSTNAWASMATSTEPSSIGIYDYIYRINRSYNNVGVINSTLVKDDSIWDVISKDGKKVIVVNVPMTYPPKKVNGLMVSGILTPETAECTYPVELKKELDDVTGGYLIGVPDPRHLDRKELLKRLYELAGIRFKAIKHLIKNKEWDFFMAVIYATDAMMHNFWRYIDKDHRKHEADSGLENAIKNFLIYVDREVGEIVELAGSETMVVLMSDHGAKRMDGRININEWLIKEGYLHLKSTPSEKTSILTADVDWNRTKAFAMGAYYGCIYLNVKGRDPEGIVEPEDAEKLKREINEKIMKIPDDKGNRIETKIFDVKPGDSAPDILAYFGNLHWGVNSGVGNGSFYSWATEKGADDAIHSTHGFFIVSGNGIKPRKEKLSIDIKDVTPFILKMMNITIPETMEGKLIDI